MNYWGYRIDTNKRGFFFDEIREGRLRQGWGYEDTHDLRGESVDEIARRNFPIFNKVKKGDILLVPRIEGWDEIVIVRAAEDFDKGYVFSIDPKMGDYGHIFPVQYEKCFSRHNINADGSIRETLKCRSRFWNINRCGEEIEKILSTPDSELRTSSSYEERFRRQVEKSFHEEAFADAVYEELNKTAQASEWEFILCEGFRRISPDSYSIDTTSNKVENDHGADIIIRIPGILNNSYIIAIQVKDYSENVSNAVVDQICKADNYFLKEEGSILIDKYIIVTRAKSEVNAELIKYAEQKNVKILFDKEVKQLLSKMGRSFLGDAIV